MADKAQPQTVRFVYEKSADYSIRYADGATASVMPSGNLHVIFFLEHAPYIQETVQEVSPTGLGDELSRKLEFDGICRHEQVGIVLAPGAVERIIELLRKTLKQMEALNAKPVETQKQ
jgi:hypothetical protein